MYRMIPRSILIAIAALFLVGCRSETLYEGLDERQANEVVAAMQVRNIPAKKAHEGKSGFSVRVATNDLPEAVDIMRREHLPSARRSQVADAFPADAMVTTPTAERARLLSAIEQRLEESITVLDEVTSARVHVSYSLAAQTAATRGETPMHVAVIAVHRPDSDEGALVQAIKRFVHNAFSNVSYDDITVLLSPEEPERIVVTTSSQSNPVLYGLLALMACLAMVAVILVLVRLRGVIADRWSRGRFARSAIKPTPSDAGKREER